MAILASHEGEDGLGGVTRLLLHPRKIDCPAIDARGRAGLEPAHRQADFPQAGRKRYRSRISGPPTLVFFHADVDQPREESPGRKDDALRAKLDAGLCDYSGRPATFQEDVVHRLLENAEIGLVLEPGADGLSIEDAVGLGPRRPHRQSF